ncbi:MAG TPA: cyclic nucleotide-binding domain-containing protein [Gammaproteobacteria bacterium]|nr:cyclic nucleotide-binding domain-containing protein [Gammaproteobacteria bacterium]
MSDPRIDLMQAMPIFGGVSAATLDDLTAAAAVVTRPKGQYFFREGEDARSMFVLQSGKVSVLKTWQGRDYLLRYLGVGECFGEMGLITPGRRSAAVLAVSASTALEISAARLDALRRRDLEQFALIYMNIARELSRRLRDADRRYFQMKVAPRSAAEDWPYSAN